MAASSASDRFASARLVKALAICGLIALLFGACTGSSSGEVAETPTATAIDTPAAETPAVETSATETPTAEPPTVVLSDEERIAAAVAEYQANPQPEGLFAYDILDTQLTGTGVMITICGWTGETVFDNVSQTTYRVAAEPDDSGAPTVVFESSTDVSGDCLNSTLVESALQATRDYDNYWRGVTDDPASFDEIEAANFMVGPLVEQTAVQVDEWTNAGLTIRSTERDGLLPDSAVTEVLGRRWSQAELGVLELISCRTLPPDYGLYKDDILIDNAKDDSAAGEHATTEYSMVRQDGQWKMFGADGLVWADCLAFEDGWLEGINRTKPEPTSWAPWAS